MTCMSLDKFHFLEGAIQGMGQQGMSRPTFMHIRDNEKTRMRRMIANQCFKGIPFQLRHGFITAHRLKAHL